MDTTCNHTLYAMTDVFNQFFDRLHPILLPEMLSQYKWCVMQDNEQLAKSAVSCIENLVMTNRDDLKAETEEIVLRFLADLVDCSKSLEENNDIIRPSAIQVHLEIMRSVHKITCGYSWKSSGSGTINNNNRGGIGEKQFGISFAGVGSFGSLIHLVDKLMASYDSAKTVIRTINFERGSSSMEHLPLLVEQESTAFRCATEVLLALYHDASRGEDKQGAAEAKLLEVINGGLAYFLLTSSKSQRETWSKLLTGIFEQILNLPESKFRVAVPVLYMNVCEVLSVQTTKEFRTVLCKILKRVGTMYSIIPPS